ncbi:MAG: tRNA uridine-5-carboxymethylaminomethyl(34) synthesis GTPase MnmE [Bacteroidales bacterium]
MDLFEKDFFAEKENFSNKGKENFFNKEKELFGNVSVGGKERGCKGAKEENSAGGNGKLSETICAVATPSGKGGIAVIRISGSLAVDIVDPVVKISLKGKPSHRLFFTEIGDLDGLIDEGVVSLFLSPHSYTGEDVVEISCHASEYIQQRILAALLQQGARMADPGEFTMRAFLNGRIDLSQSEAVADLIASENKATHQIALQQLRGGFSSEIASLRAKLVDFASLVELELDFGEEDVEFADRGQLRELLKEIRLKTEELKNSFALGNVLKNGVPIAIIGKPNVGKSTLLNVLLHEQRALVSDIPGTTRDTIEENWVIDGVKYKFIDTAGLRYTQDEVEIAGIERAYQKMQEARVWIYIFDMEKESLIQAKAGVDKLLGGEQVWKERVLEAKEKEVDEVGKLKAGMVAGKGQMEGKKEIEKERAKGMRERGAGSFLDKIKVLYVGNKVDSFGGEKGGGEKDESEDTVFISAKYGTGIDRLEQKLKKLAKVDIGPDQIILTNARHYEIMCLVLKDISCISKSLDAEISGDLLAMDIRQALDHLGRITGEIISDDILGNIFGRFCIGK